MDFSGPLSKYAGQPQSEAVLFGVSALEGALFPVAADELLVPMVILEDSRAFRYALIATVGSVFGALLAFDVAFILFQSLGEHVLAIPGMQIPFMLFKTVVVGYAALIVLAAGFSSAPYKIVTVLSGVLGANILVFIAASCVSRAARFYFIAWTLWRGGPMKKIWLEKSFYGFSTVVSLALLMIFTFLIFLMKTS